LGIDLSSIRVCKIINGVKRCGLKRVFKRGKVYYIERISIFTIIIYRKRLGSIENIKNKGKFTKFTKYGSCWEKKTVRMNDSARDLMYEFSIEELMKNEQFKKEVCGGKTLSWREIFKIMEKNKKNIQKFYLKKSETNNKFQKRKRN